MDNIRNQIIKGSLWIAIAKYSGIVVQIGISAILARLILPSAFGTIAVAMVILHFLNILADIGIGPAVVQYKQLTKHHLDSLFTLNIYIGLALALVLFGCSGLIADFYGDIVLVRVCEAMSLVILFNSLNVVPNALMRKDKRFKTIALRTLFFQVTSGAIAIWGAFRGWGIYALLVSPVLTAIGVFCVNYYNYPMKYVARMSKKALAMVSSYSFYQFAFSFCNYFSRNLDKLIIGKYFSLTQLGYYEKSYHLMVLPLQNVTFVIEPVLHPILSSLQDNPSELCHKNRKLAVTIANISFPIGLILYFCSGEIIRIIYGSQWNAAIPVFRILALSLPLQMIQSTSGAIYQAAGKTKHMFYNGIVNTLSTVVGFIVAASYFGTLESMAWAWDITLLFNFILSYFVIHHFTFKQQFIPFMTSLLKPLANAFFVFFFLNALQSVLMMNNIFMMLGLKVIVITLLTVLFALLFCQYNAFAFIPLFYKHTKVTK